MTLLPSDQLYKLEFKERVPRFTCLLTHLNENTAEIYYAIAKEAENTLCYVRYLSWPGVFLVAHSESNIMHLSDSYTPDRFGTQA